MQWRLKQKLIICAVLVFGLVLIYLAWYTNQDISVKITLLGVVLAVPISLLPILLKGDHQYDKDKLNHSEHLIRDVFGKPIVPASVIYDHDEIHQTYVEWAETSPVFDFAIQHLEYKKYKNTWRAYIDGKKDAEIKIIKIIDKIQQYREIVEYHLNHAKLPLKVRENESPLREGEYDKKLINHLIFYDIHNKTETGATNKKLVIFPIDVNQLLHDSIYHLDWCDDHPHLNGGAVSGERISKGDRVKMEYLQNVIEGLENNSELRALILEIDSLKRTLENNPELEMFEDGRLEIVDKVKIVIEVLAGKCNRCP